MIDHQLPRQARSQDTPGLVSLWERVTRIELALQLGKSMALFTADLVVR
jgi:hypothetical protein